MEISIQQPRLLTPFHQPVSKLDWNEADWRWRDLGDILVKNRDVYSKVLTEFVGVLGMEGSRVITFLAT